MSYSIDNARHRFSLWAACRAAQAGSAKAKRHQFIDALLKCGVVEWIGNRNHHSATRDTYDSEFEKWVSFVKRHLEEEFGKPVSYGVSAKLISTYLKSVFILAEGAGTPLGKHVMPPIDSILLKAVDKNYGSTLSKQFKWQKLSQVAYNELVGKLRELHGEGAMWELEKDWVP